MNAETQPNNNSKLVEALVAFQAEMPIVGKDQTATVPMKSGGKYSYRYADLADIVRAATPHLTAHGLAFVTYPEPAEGGGLQLTGALLHTSGGRITGTLPLQGHTPQEIGSAITYARRYLFGCLTGIVTDEDDDGAQAQRAARAQRTRPADPRTDLVNRIAHGLDQMGAKTGPAKLEWLTEKFGRPLGSPWELSDEEMRVALDDLEGVPA